MPRAVNVVDNLNDLKGPKRKKGKKPRKFPPPLTPGYEATPSVSSVVYGKVRGKDALTRRFLIEGQMPRKSNQRKLIWNRKTGAPLFIKSDEALEWTERAIGVMKSEPEQVIDKPCGMRAWVFYRSRRSDLSVELLKDAMQKAGVVLNDRLIEYEENFVFVDKDRPRVIVEIWELPEKFEPPEDPMKKGRPLIDVL